MLAPRATRKIAARTCRATAAAAAAMFCCVTLILCMYVCIERQSCGAGRVGKQGLARQFLVAKQYKQDVYLFELATQSFYIFDGRLDG